jgi:type I restriction enzyme S subunit
MKGRTVQLKEVLNADRRTNRLTSSARQKGKYPFFTNSTTVHNKFLDEFDYDGEYIIANTGGAAYFDYYNGKFAAMADCLNLTSDQNTKYIYYCLLHLQKVVNQRCFKGSGLKHLDKNSFYKLNVSLPGLSDQDRVAEMLTEVDALIENTADTIKASAALKKVLLVDFFNEASKKWEMQKLDDLAIRGSGHTPSKSHPEYYDGGIKWISLADSSALDKGVIANTTNEISELGIKNSSARLHPTGTVVLSRDAGVGKVGVMGEDMAVSQHFMTWTCGSKLNNWFLYYYLQSRRKELERIAVGSTIRTIGLDYFKKLEVPAPVLEEQMVISELLVSLDEKIKIYRQIKHNQERLKRALMQELLSSKEQS